MKKPSNTKSITAKKTWWMKILPFQAMTVCGTIYVGTDSALKQINATEGIDSPLENHEMVHVRQAWSTKNCWLLFYLTYMCEWLYNLPLLFIDVYAPYKFMPMELEAYRHQYEKDYNVDEMTTGWKKYTTLKMSTRRSLAKEWYGGESKKSTFADFIKKRLG